MPMTWNQVNNMPDIASNNRFKVFFPTIDNLDTKVLTDLVHGITVPQNSLGHIQVRLFGGSVAFAGGRTFDNTLQATFYENVRGQGLSVIEAWKSKIRDRDGNRGRKFVYAKNGTLEIYDTIGKTIHSVSLLNMWPMTIEYPQLDEAGSAPLEFTVTFSVDFAELMVP